MNLEEIKLLPRFKDVEMPGVYFLFCNEQVVYIGQSKNIMSRITTHKLEKVKEFDSFSYKIIWDEEVRKSEESFLIMKHSPLYNKTIGKKKTTFLKWFCDAYGMDANETFVLLHKDGVLPCKGYDKRDPLLTLYYQKDLAPYVAASKVDSRKKRIEDIKREDAGRGIINHYEDAKRLMKGEKHNKLMFKAVMKVTGYYQEGFSLEDALKQSRLNHLLRVDYDELERIVMKEPEYLDNKRKLYEQYLKEKEEQAHAMVSQMPVD